MSILQLLEKENLLLSPGIQHKNFNYLILLHPSIVTSSHLLRILILKLWLASGQERLMERQFSIKCICILKTTTRNQLEKRGKMKIWWIVELKGRKIRREFRYQAMLQWFLSHFHIFIMSAWTISITALGKWKNKYIYSFSHSCCTNFLGIHVLRHDCKYWANTSNTTPRATFSREFPLFF